MGTPPPLPSHIVNRRGSPRAAGAPVLHRLAPALLGQHGKPDLAQEPERLRHGVDEVVMRPLGEDLAFADHHLRPLPLRRIDEAVLEEVLHGIGARATLSPPALRGSTSWQPNSSAPQIRVISCATLMPLARASIRRRSTWRLRQVRITCCTSGWKASRACHASISISFGRSSASRHAPQIVSADQSFSSFSVSAVSSEARI